MTTSPMKRRHQLKMPWIISTQSFGEPSMPTRKWIIMKKLSDLSTISRPLPYQTSRWIPFKKLKTWKQMPPKTYILHTDGSRLHLEFSINYCKEFRKRSLLEVKERTRSKDTKKRLNTLELWLDPRAQPFPKRSLPANKLNSIKDWPLSTNSMSKSLPLNKKPRKLWIHLERALRLLKSIWSKPTMEPKSQERRSTK